MNSLVVRVAPENVSVRRILVVAPESIINVTPYVEVNHVLVEEKVFQVGQSGAPGPKGSQGAPGVQDTVDPFLLTRAEIEAKQLSLSTTPISPSRVRVSIVGGCSQSYGSDFIVAGQTLSWDGLGMEDLLTAGDKLIVEY